MRMLILAALMLAGCAVSPGEVVDQGGHYALGYARAKELRRNTSATDAEIMAEVMRAAERREEFQHPGRCGEGCRRDLDWWRKGVEAALR